jgi:hypothetical protein
MEDTGELSVFRGKQILHKQSPQYILTELTLPTDERKGRKLCNRTVQQDFLPLIFSGMDISQAPYLVYEGFSKLTLIRGDIHNF